MEQLVETALELYVDIKKSLRDERHRRPDNAEMVNVIVRIIEFDASLDEVQRTVGQLMHCFADTRTLVPEMKRMQDQLNRLSASLDERQRRRQTQIWALVEPMRQRVPAPTVSPGNNAGSVVNASFTHADQLCDAISSMTLADEDIEESEQWTLKAEEALHQFESLLLCSEGAEEGGEGKDETEEKEDSYDSSRWDTLLRLST